MPDKVRYIQRRNAPDFDRYVSKLVEEKGYGAERVYFGCESEEEADQIRRGMRQAGRHLGVAVKAYWQPCTGCEQGGRSCVAHVRFTAYSPVAARLYMERKAKRTRR